MTIFSGSQDTTNNKKNPIINKDIFFPGFTQFDLPVLRYSVVL